MMVEFVEQPGSPQVTVTARIASKDKDAFERDCLGSSHSFAQWLKAVDVQYIQPDDEPGESPEHLTAVVIYQPDRDNSLFPPVETKKGTP
jgi:hypothetical protein